MFELMGKKIIKILRKYNFLIWTYGKRELVAVRKPLKCQEKNAFENVICWSRLLQIIA